MNRVFAVSSHVSFVTLSEDVPRRLDSEAFQVASLEQVGRTGCVEPGFMAPILESGEHTFSPKMYESVQDDPVRLSETADTRFRENTGQKSIESLQRKSFFHEDDHARNREPREGYR